MKLQQNDELSTTRIGL